MSIVIGLTGPTGAGKSTVSYAAACLGIRVIDCDKVARQAVEKGTPGLNAVVKEFGREILFADGSLNRKALAEIAFANSESTKRLNDTVFPYIERLVLAQMGDDALLDAPTLFESGIDRFCDHTIAVLADSSVRLNRIIERDSLTLKEAQLRMHAGKNDDFYLERADYVIYNNGNKDELNDKAFLILKNLFGGK